MIDFKHAVQSIALGLMPRHYPRVCYNKLYSFRLFLILGKSVVVIQIHARSGVELRYQGFNTSSIAISMFVAFVESINNYIDGCLN